MNKSTFVPLNRDLHKQLKMFCIENDSHLKYEVSTAVKYYLDNYKKMTMKPRKNVKLRKAKTKMSCKNA